MKIKVVIHEAEEGGYWAEVPGMSMATAISSMERNLRSC